MCLQVDQPGWRKGGSPEDFVLQLLELALAGGDVDDQRVLLLLQLWPLLSDHNAQQLRLQTLAEPAVPRMRDSPPHLCPHSMFSIHLPQLH